MIATCPATIGSDAMFFTCATASYSTSTPFVQARTLFNALRSMVFSIGKYAMRWCSLLGFDPAASCLLGRRSPN